MWCSASSNLEDSGLFTGVIDGKFDDGYIVTVKLGAEDLKGVLYHVVPDVSQSFSISDDPGHNTKRKHQAARDPSHPKRNRSGYTFFFAEQYQILRPSYHGHERAISKKIGQLWSNLTEAEKEVNIHFDMFWKQIGCIFIFLLEITCSWLHSHQRRDLRHLRHTSWTPVFPTPKACLAVNA